MILYHRTPAAKDIMEKGFKDSESNYLTNRKWSGVWLSDRPLDSNEGAKGNQVLTVEIPDEVISEYEWVNEGFTYREFLVPAELVNRYDKPEMFEDDSIYEKDRELLRRQIREAQSNL